MDNRPVGVFDSGLGGLTVLKEMRRLLPDEHIIYFGDCGRAPYGIKSPETIRRYTFQNIRFFLDAGVKLLVIACNTSSAYGYEHVAGALDIPVVEVIRPGAAEAVRATRNKRIGVIGTSATVSSGIYQKVIKRLDPSVEVYAKACPLFVPLAEEGPRWWRHESARVIAREYLGGFGETGIDCLVLGCTHYPLLDGVIREAVGEGIALINSARAAATVARDTLRSLGIGREAEDGAPADVRFFTSDSPEKFGPLCGAILGEPVERRASRLDIDKYESGLL